MSGLTFTQKMYVKAMFRDRMADLHGTAFETFFHQVMTLRYPDFVAVRTHGNIGDLSADGLSLHDRKLYACYGPEVFDAKGAKDVEKKFAGDLAGALAKRKAEFETFVFVYNDPRQGLHPVIAGLLAQARAAHPQLRFEPLGPERLLRRLYELPRGQIEEVFGAEIPVKEVVHAIGLADLEPLLEHLVANRTPANGQHRPAPLPEVSGTKMDYNQLTEDDREVLLRGMRHTYLLDEYYAGRADVTARDETAKGFNAYYRQVAQVCTTPSEIIYELGSYVLGNQRPPRPREMALGVILAYFFENCDIFEAPPADWVSHVREVALS
ncbi:ABC-three component system protein [Longispora albida]|uniref:ABC-three component system protein n=1 Tax=Longispora albida TaxID=203523 RepID=UPI00036F586A|nr:ABC-three component system protein [Longispora albida]